MTPSEHHDKISFDVLRSLMRQVEEADASFSETMVILESIILGVLLANERLHLVSRRSSVELLEVTTERVLERLALVLPVRP